ncbi:ABC transporter permease [Paenibacillus doosanensis]|uniref:Nickel import system permease protein NikB n=1 Tax=Paenibacillus konkukensis TaxID=2020716 RepID=A0ABY4RTD1_9BACL|nr:MULTISPECIES: nickel ABC transporter permease [Paenibacillus]MCS7464714.1 ABC transporter permease [Paenibacillus doosanensis]UQZ85846.1 Nickel transport system permease protein NikB [Paenibacillus konkukensis]
MAYLIRRIAAAIPILIGISLVAFVLSAASPGDPAVEALTQNGVKEPSEQEIAAMREQLGLNDPFAVQYGRWLFKAVQGDLGTSYMTKESVSAEIVRRLPVTLSVSLLAVLFAAGGGIPLGMLMALKKNGPLDHVGRAVALIVVSVPGFWLAILLITLFSEKLHWLPTSGYGSLRHLIMPAVVLASGTSAVLMRLTRASLLEVWNHNYILTAKAKGLHDALIMLRHALRNALIPLVTVLGTYFGAILGGSVIVEVIFALPGIGRFAIDGIFRRDYPVIQGYVVFTGVVYVAFNLLVDFSYVLIHPQMRLGGKLR